MFFNQMEDKGLKPLPHLLKIIFFCCFGMALCVGQAHAAQVEDFGDATEKLASHYGHDDGFDGKTMANGGIMNKNDPTIVATHQEYPLNTRLRLENPENGRQIDVCARDRMGTKRRGLDVSYAAAVALGFANKGVTELIVQVVGMCEPYKYKKEASHKA